MKITKEICLKAIVTEFYNKLKQDLKENPLMGTPLEGLAVIESLNDSKEKFKKTLTNTVETSEINYEFSKNEVDEIVNLAYKSVYERIIEI